MQRTAVLTLSFAVVAACHDARRAATPTSSLQPGAHIDADNALAVAGVAWTTVNAPARAVRALTTFLELDPATAPPAAAGTSTRSREVAGPEGGTATWTWNDRDHDERYSSGDTFELALYQYGIDSQTFSGWAWFEDLAVAGNLPTAMAWTASARLRLRNLRVGIGGVAANLNGSFDCERERRATVTLQSLRALDGVTVDGTLLHAGSTIAHNDYLLDFSQAVFLAGSCSDRRLDGTLELRTKAPLTGIQVMPNPWAGEFEIRGAGPTVLTVAPIDLFNAELRLDADGDEVVETTIPVEWSQLFAQAP